MLGLFGASHCLVMCGGIAAAAGQQAGEHRLRAAL
ncbi:MAG: sulfite exporter TauE/SafE family protein, partial [Oleibacter sp.]|nr:sulfite exporter TauE/SafE family protein [Thalassolituus sp.]